MMNLLREAENLKRRSRRLRDEHDHEGAADALNKAIGLLDSELERLKESPDSLMDAPGEDVRLLADQLADCWGSLGGIRRRQNRLTEALAAYASGRELERRYHVASTYNQIQWLILRILSSDNPLATLTEMHGDLVQAEEALRRQIATARREDPWAWCDLGLLRVLKGQEAEAKQAWDQMDALNPILTVYSSGLAVLNDLTKVLPASEPLARTVNRFSGRLATVA